MNVNIVLYDDFDLLDVFGPAQVFGMIPKQFYVNYLSVNGGIVNSAQGAKIWTELLIPREIEGIIVIPGGRGVKKLLCIEEKTLTILKESVQEADICMMVRNGSLLVAQTGLLYHRQIAETGGTEDLEQLVTAEINRIPQCKWIADGKYYSCCSSASSIDMALGVISDMVDMELANQAAEKIGYDWDEDGEW